MTDDTRPFTGLTVIDCASYIAGPAAATILADLGADVIKLEPPDGDPMRSMYRLPGAVAAERNYPWDLDARSKRSLVLDMKHPEAAAVLHRLLARADVFITNLPLPVRRKLGLDAADLLPPHPRLVYASMTAYGETGPEADKGGFDGTAYWARSGLSDMVRSDDTAPPSKSVGAMGDHPSAVTLFAAISAALYRRERTGRGGLVSTSLLANGLWANSLQVQAYLSGARYPAKVPRERAANALINLYRCADGRWLNLMMLNEGRQWPVLVDALGIAEDIADGRFATRELREARSAQLVRLLDQAFARHTLAHWRRVLDAAGITFGVVGTLADIPDDEQMRAAGMVVPSDHGAGWTVANPVRLHGADGRCQPRPPGPAPALGEHSRAVLAEAGLDPAEIDRLAALGLFGPPAG